MPRPTGYLDVTWLLMARNLASHDKDLAAYLARGQEHVAPRSLQGCLAGGQVILGLMLGQYWGVASDNKCRNRPTTDSQQVLNRMGAHWLGPTQPKAWQSCPVAIGRPFMDGVAAPSNEVVARIISPEICLGSALDDP